MFSAMRYPAASFEVIGFTPPDREHRDSGGWGFEIHLSLAFARLCLATPLPDGAVTQMERRCRDLVVDRAMPGRLEHFHSPVLSYYQASTLLATVEVPGVNGAWLSMLEDDRALDSLEHRLPDAALTYTTHNIDSMAQAFALMSCWLHWHLAVSSLFRSMGR